MEIGVAYYPERQNPDMWPKHFELMRNAGIKRIRIGEFAWAVMEPDEGQFCWDWLDEVIDLAGQYDIGVVLCTPTATPPIWLVEKYPDVLPVNKYGQRLVFGKRQHRCYNSPSYNKYSAIIVEALGKRYGSHPNVVAWQLDNELGGELKQCFCENCAKTFRQELELKYKTIDELNKRWGTTFWSQNYQRFDQIPVPLAIDPELLMRHHPSLELEFARFSSQSIVRFCRMQAKILRKYTNAPITTNTDTFLFGDNVNLVELFRDLDIGGIDVYSQDLNEISFYSDFMASLKDGRFWMMEYGVNSPNLYNEMKLLQNHGCEWLYFFTFNPFPAGQEQGEGKMVNGILTLTGQTTPTYHTIRQWTCDNVTQEEEGIQNKKDCDIGVYYHFDSSWVYFIASWAKEIVEKQIYPRYLKDTVYRSLYEEKLPMRFVFSPEEIKGLKLLILPMQIIYDPQLEEALISFVQQGGKLIVTEDLFRKNQDNVYLTYVPKIFSVLFDHRENDFIRPARNKGDFVIKSNPVNEGYVWMVRQDGTLEDWRSLTRSIMSNK